MFAAIKVQSSSCHVVTGQHKLDAVDYQSPLLSESELSAALCFVCFIVMLIKLDHGWREGIYFDLWELASLENDSVRLLSAAFTGRVSDVFFTAFSCNVVIWMWMMSEVLSPDINWSLRVLNWTDKAICSVNRHHLVHDLGCIVTGIVFVLGLPVWSVVWRRPEVSYILTNIIKKAL